MIIYNTINHYSALYISLLTIINHNINHYYRKDSVRFGSAGWWKTAQISQSVLRDREFMCFVLAGSSAHPVSVGAAS